MAAIPIVLTYRVPQGLRVPVGSRVVVPVRKTVKVGIAVSVETGQDDVPGLRPIERVLDAEPLIPLDLLDLLLWVSRYYHTPAGATLALAFPPYLRQARPASPVHELRIVRTGTGRGVVGPKQHEILQGIPKEGISRADLQKRFPGCSSSVKALIRRGFLEQRPIAASGSPLDMPESSIIHTPEQAEAIQRITDAMDKGEFRSFLLHGVTGSGKTEVYLACATKALSLGRSVLYLVPEIALTPQTISMIRARIPIEVAVFHSGLSPAVRTREFIKTSRSSVGFVLGTRSAIFSPLANLGLIVVDEEHDHSYKQEDGVPYNARDLSLLRAKNSRAVVVLGSATPSMETFIRSSGKDSRVITMTARTGNAGLPLIEIIDMRGVRGEVSEQLGQAVQETLDKGELALLVIYRRGYSPA
ncbi:MAG: primosomal protein N', partial [Desulfomonilia bacterium]|nr:primosomal protein N' [Desulfomonilia bacterium]